MTSRERVVTRLAQLLARGDVSAVSSLLSHSVRARSDVSFTTADGRTDAATLLMAHVTGPLVVQSVNGSPGIVVRGTRGVVAVLCPSVRLGRISAIWIVAHPEHLMHFSPVTDRPPDLS